MKRYISGIFLVASLMLFTGQGFCKPPEDYKRPPSGEQLEKLRKRVETLKMWKLTKSLDLNEETASKLFPLIKEYDKKRLSVEIDMRKDIKKLRKTINTASEAELRDIIKKLKYHHKKLQEINDEEMGKLSDILTYREMARFIIFKQDFDREMRNIISEVREKRLKRFRDKDENEEE